VARGDQRRERHGGACADGRANDQGHGSPVRAEDTTRGRESQQKCDAERDDQPDEHSLDRDIDWQAANAEDIDPPAGDVEQPTLRALALGNSTVLWNVIWPGPLPEPSLLETVGSGAIRAESVQPCENPAKVAAADEPSVAMVGWDLLPGSLKQTHTKRAPAPFCEPGRWAAKQRSPRGITAEAGEPYLGHTSIILAWRPGTSSTR
jgi:hypothetical protein